MTLRMAAASGIDNTKFRTADYSPSKLTLNKVQVAMDKTPILFFTLTNNEWTAWSAIGTIFSALVALLLPVWINGRAKREAKREKAQRYHEIASATYNAIDVFHEADNALSQGTYTALGEHAAARARMKAESLRVLSRFPNLGDGPIECAVGSAQFLDRIVEAQELAARGKTQDAKNEMSAARVVAREVFDRVGKVVKYNEIPVRAGRTLPNKP